MYATGGPANGNYGVYVPGNSGSNGLHQVAFSGSGTPETFYVDDIHNLNAVVVPSPGEGAFALELEDSFGRVYFKFITDLISSSDIENIQFTIVNTAGTCTLQAITAENSLNGVTPGFPNPPYDGANVQQVCGNDHRWWLDHSLNEGCSVFTPVMVPVPGQAGGGSG